MIKRIWVFLVVLLLFSLSFQGFSVKDISEDIAYVKIDGFEVPGEWTVYYSKFRTKSWQPDAKERDKSEDWLKWIKSDDAKPNFERKYIVPQQVYKSKMLADELTVLSVRGDWDKKGLNWLALEPTNRRLSKQRMTIHDPLEKRIYRFDDLSKNYILLPGMTKILYTFIWGMGFNYKVEIQVLDYKGNLHVIPGAYLNYYGWRNIQFSIPHYIKQSSRLLPRIRPLKFIRFKIVSAREEENHGFFTYLDYIHTRTDIYEANFFGSRLGNAEEVYWKDEQNTNSPKQ